MVSSTQLPPPVVAIGLPSASPAAKQPPKSRLHWAETQETLGLAEVIQIIIADTVLGTCRAGDNCSYLHSNEKFQSQVGHGESSDLVQDRRQAVTQPIASRIVPKPVSQVQPQDPREYQLGQLRRRFSPKELKQPDGTTILKFTLTPSDPDFPFEMSALECSLYVPPGYPRDIVSLKVGNKEIPRGFALNIEFGFSNLIDHPPNKTLLELVKALDKNLESFLSAPKADTVKLVPNKDRRHLLTTPARSVEPATASSKADSLQPMQSATTVSTKSNEAAAKPVVIFTAQQKAEASKRRENEVRQLEARMGRLPLYRKSADGIAYTLPVEPRRRSELPTAIQAVKSVRLFVPLLYPLQSCRIQLEGVDLDDSKAVERGFELRTSEQKETTLMGHINHLAQNMHVFAKTILESKPITATIVSRPAMSETASLDKGKGVEGQQDTDRSHIQYIARPPEWTTLHHEEHSNSESDFYDSYDSGDDDTDEASGADIQAEDEKLSVSNVQSRNDQQRGTAISFPFIELYGIELMELVTLNVTIKCERCRDIMEVNGLKNGVPKSESCKKCASTLTINFRRDFVHAHAVRAGFLDLEGCAAMDMLPSTFIPTCSGCSTTYPLPGIISVQGETTSNICRECHQKFTFKIPQTKFLRISQTDRLPPSIGPRKKKEVLGLVAGTELPKRGRCRHYTKSFRWFRFSCCQKVYACDKCHDEGEEHPNEWANRMICGWCSREGNYRPEDCGFCHGVLTGKRGGGFWEGGKGTRDKVKMSRKDKRKYRRIGGSKS
ncbi:hypothetical protein HYALB_00000767 [Hymenoscyphus albidus]|uniref:CHY-type domain-containing protein n=1 Tax=Hymenoscyphus albidus TaxID=595503 RepID=A0A9N9LMN0_9HELO|nr:hypothetical protein HYALB_00000767 [Hymenoscyphus albidus]